MTVFEKIKSMDINEFAEWFDNHCSHDSDLCIGWWDKTYCKNCEPVIGRYEDSIIDIEFGWCELHGKCKYFQELESTPDTLQITKLWLESEF